MKMSEMMWQIDWKHTFIYLNFYILLIIVQWLESLNFC